MALDHHEGDQAYFDERAMGVSHSSEPIPETNQGI